MQLGRLPDFRSEPENKSILAGGGNKLLLKLKLHLGLLPWRTLHFFCGEYKNKMAKNNIHLLEKFIKLFLDAVKVFQSRKFWINYLQKIREIAHNMFWIEEIKTLWFAEIKYLSFSTRVHRCIENIVIKSKRFQNIFHWEKISENGKIPEVFNRSPRGADRIKRGADLLFFHRGKNFFSSRFSLLLSIFGAGRIAA